MSVLLRGVAPSPLPLAHPPVRPPKAAPGPGDGRSRGGVRPAIPFREGAQRCSRAVVRRGRTLRRVFSAKLLLALVVLSVVALMVLRTGSAKRDFVNSFQHFGGARLWWLALAVTAEAASLFFYGLAQRRLLAAGGAHISRRTASGLALGSTGIAALVPVGALPASGWLVAQYRLRSITWPLALWAVLAGGFAATVSVLAMVLVGGAIAGIGAPALLLGAGVFLAVGSAAFVVSVRHLDRLQALFRRRGWPRGSRLLAGLTGRTSEVVQYRAGVGGGTAVFVYSILNWLGDALCLVAAFGLAGLPLPWRAALFAFALSQVAGSLSPLPAGIGVVEGGLVGAFSLAGVPAGNAFVATVIYRVIGYWAVAGLGAVIVLAMSRRLARRAPAQISPAAGIVAAGLPADLSRAGLAPAGSAPAGLAPAGLPPADLAGRSPAGVGRGGEGHTRRPRAVERRRLRCRRLTTSRY